MTLFLPAVPSWGQPDSAKIAERRREKLELILRFQDLRTVHDGKLISFLSDPDTVVRERAVRAFGSIQDTGVLHFLTDRLFDRSSSVQSSAAFAIGQTAGLLSERGRQRLEYDLIWTRLDRTRVPEELIEELGKFGTEQGLRDLISRFGGTYPPRHSIPLMMSIARFAIRDVIAEEAVLYLLRFIKPVDSAPWQVVYALQRIGDHTQTRYEIEHIVQLYKHPDPVVRMHLGILLGKIKEGPGSPAVDDNVLLEPLQRLAEFDPDWRVRVSALRSLGKFRLEGWEELIRTFFRAFSEENLHISLTAISTFGNTGLKKGGGGGKESFELLRRMAANRSGHYLWQKQGEAAIALAKLTGASALPDVNPTSWPEPRLQAQLLIATAHTGSLEAQTVLFDAATFANSRISCAALEGLQILSRKNRLDSALIQKAYETYLDAVEKSDMAVVTTAATILGDSLFRRTTSVVPVIQALSRRRIPHDIEVIQELIATLGRLKDLRAEEILIEHLQKPDRSIALASASALHSITGRDYKSRLPRSFEPLLTDFDFQFLRSLPDTVPARIETIRGDIIIELYKNAAPFTVMNLARLARRGFYRGLVFHRVVANFVIQGGDPRGDGWGGPDYTIRSEFADGRYEEGSIGMASAGKDTEGSQFFITHSPQPHLEGRYTLFGRVVSGMDVVNKIQVEDRIFDVKIGR